MTQAKPMKVYRLEPAGLGTAAVEALTSLTMRLASLHHVSTSTLLRTTALPLLRTNPDGITRIADVAANGSAANGAGREARAWLDVMKSVFGRDDLDAASCVRFGSVLSSWHLLRGSVAFCLECLEEMAALGLVYEPLAWMMRLVTACPRHGTRLQTECGWCGHRQQPLRLRGRPGICGLCRRWLGNAAMSVEAPVDEIRVSTSVGNLLATGADARHTTLAQVSRAIDLAVDSRGWTRAEFAEAASVATGSLSAWRRGESKPSLEGVLRICAVGGWDLAAIVCGRLEYSASAAGSLGAPRRRRGAIDWIAIEAELTRRLTDEIPPSLETVAADLGIYRHSLRRRLPLAASALVRRHSEWQAERAATRAQGAEALVMNITRELQAEGVRPSRRRVEARLPSNLRLKEPKLGLAWRAAVTAAANMGLEDAPAA